jgi:hypothetical protein
MIRSRAVATGAIVLALTACTSPEGKRVRGGGPGSDVKNRNPVVQMHAGSEMYYETPCQLPNEKCTGPRPASGLPGDFPVPK